jgi:hypothetical protein
MFGHTDPRIELLLIHRRHADLLRAAEASAVRRRRRHPAAPGIRLRRRLRFPLRRRPPLIARRV